MTARPQCQLCGAKSKTALVPGPDGIEWRLCKDRAKCKPKGELKPPTHIPIQRPVSLQTRIKMSATQRARWRRIDREGNEVTDEED